MKFVLGLLVLVMSLSTFAKEKQYCGKITHLTLHTNNGQVLYNFGMSYGFGGGSNSFAWLDMRNQREKEILELVKLAKADDLTFCATFGLPENGEISVR